MLYKKSGNDCSSNNRLQLQTTYSTLCSVKMIKIQHFGNQKRYRKNYTPRAERYSTVKEYGTGT